MCGLFGAICKGRRSLTASTIRNLAVAQEKRGPHAFGFAWIDSSNRIHYYKQQGRISQALHTLDMIGDAWAVIGHTRWLTHGSAERMENNHPHSCDGGWIAHNGQIPNYLELADEHDLILNSECDSEVLAALIAQTGGGKSLIRRISTSVNRCDRNRPLAMAGLWNRPGRLALVRRGNPIMLGEGAAGNVYFGTSRIKSTRMVWTAMDDNEVRVFDLTSGDESTRSVYRSHPPKVGEKVLGSNFFGERNCFADNPDLDGADDRSYNWDALPQAKRGSNGHTSGGRRSVLGYKGPGMVQRATRLITEGSR